MPPAPGAMLRTTMRAILIRFTVTLTPGCLDRMVATNCSLTGRTKQQRYKGTCGAAEFAESSRENWSHGEQIVIVNGRLWSGPPRVRMSSLAMPAAVKLRRPRRTYFRALAAQIAPELCKPVSLEETRAQGKPGARCTRSLARKTKSARASSPQVHRNSPAFPAQWF